jgi:hypothetical protein
MSSRKSTFMLSKFSDHVYDWDSYCKAMHITPPIHENRDLMSIALIKRLVNKGDETCVRVLEDMKYGIGMWISSSGLYVDGCKRAETQYWMFAAYEACVAGNAVACHGCLDEARIEGARDCVVQMSLEFLATIWNAHNSVKMTLVRCPNQRLAFNDCIYNCMLHTDPVGIEAIIRTYEIDLGNLDYYTRDKIKQRAKMHGYESCKKVLDENDFF